MNAKKPSASETDRKPYATPQILYKEKMEAMATTCGGNKTGTGADFPPCTTPPFFS